MEITQRQGDYSMCCVELATPLSLVEYQTAAPIVEVDRREGQVEVKLEEDSRHIFVLAREIRVNTADYPAYAFTADERAWRPRRVCLVATGPGPVPNRMKLTAISLRGCEHDQ